MSWKNKLFTLINTRFYTKEEVDSKATVVFIGYTNFRCYYNEQSFQFDKITMGTPNSYIDSYILVMELPFEIYNISDMAENNIRISQDENGNCEVNQKFMVVDLIRYLGEPQE